MSESLSLEDFARQQSQNLQKNRRRQLIRAYGMLLALLALVVLAGVATGGRFLRTRNLINILEQVTPVGIIAIGVTLVIITGGIDLSLGSVIALAGVVGAVIARDGGGATGLLAMAVTLAVGALCGLLNGVVVAYGKIPPFIVTLGMMTAARGVAGLVSAGRPVGNLPAVLNWLGSQRPAGIPGVIFVYLVVAVLGYLLLSKMCFGRHILAIGGNVNAARLCGIKVEKLLVRVYLLAGITAGISGFILVTTTQSGNPTYGLQYELDAIAATVIGGTSLSGGAGSIPLCIVGALIVGVINNSLNLLGVDPYWQQVVKGMIIVLAVLLDNFKKKRS